MIADPALAEPEPKVHLIANLVVLTPPRYAKLPANALEAYLELMAALMNALPVHALEPPESNAHDAPSTWTNGDGMDTDESDEEERPAPRVTVVTTFDPPPRLPELDKRTRTRLQTLPSSQHLNSLLSAAQHHPSRQSLITFCFALTTVWPTRRDKVLGTVVVFNGGGLLREIYRLYVRSSPLGREDTLSSLTSTYVSCVLAITMLMNRRPGIRLCVATALVPCRLVYASAAHDGRRRVLQQVRVDAAPQPAHTG